MPISDEGQFFGAVVFPLLLRIKKLEEKVEELSWENDRSIVYVSAEDVIQRLGTQPDASEATYTQLTAEIDKYINYIASEMWDFGMSSQFWDSLDAVLENRLEAEVKEWMKLIPEELK